MAEKPENPEPTRKVLVSVRGKTREEVKAELVAKLRETGILEVEKGGPERTVEHGNDRK